MNQQARLGAGISHQVCLGCLSEPLRDSQSTSIDFLIFFPMKDGEVFTSVSDFCLLLHDCIDKKPVPSKSCLNAQNTVCWDNKVPGIETFHSKCGNVHRTCTAQTNPAPSPGREPWVTLWPKILTRSKVHKPKHPTNKSQWTWSLPSRKPELITLVLLEWLWCKTDLKQRSEVRNKTCLGSFNPVCSLDSCHLNLGQIWPELFNPVTATQSKKSMWLHRYVGKGSKLRCATQVNNLNHGNTLFEAVPLTKCMPEWQKRQENAELW